MKINNLKLLNFRNYNKLEISFTNNTNIIFGNNGTGKTNLVEAIYILALTKSFRKINDKNLITIGNNVCKVEGNIEEKEKITNYKVIFKEEEKIVKINNFKEKKISNYISNVVVVFFGPDDLKVIKETPQVRRKMLNIELSLLNKDYLLLITIYNKILKQRNSYLKKMSVNNSNHKIYLDILTEKLISHAEKICLIRGDFIDNINKYLGNIYFKITGNSSLKVEYKSNIANYNSKDIQNMFDNYLKKEIILGTTLLGIHKDDLIFYLDNQEMITYASEGQIKNAILAFKLAEIEYIVKLKDDYPIVIFDDLFSELDKEKINNIIKLINNDMQLFITTTDVDLLDKDVKLKSNLLDIKKILKEGSINGK